MKIPGILKSKSDIILGIALISSGIVAGYAYYHSNDVATEADSRQAEIGSLSSGKTSVRYRHGNSLVWQDVEANQSKKVRAGDAVFTASESSATVSLIKGVDLGIEPNSLVVFKPNEKAPEAPPVLAVEKGSLKITVKKGSNFKVEPLIIESKGKTYQLPLSESDAGQALTLSVPEKEGESISVKKANGENVELTEVARVSTPTEALATDELRPEPEVIAAAPIPLPEPTPELVENPVPEDAFDRFVAMPRKKVPRLKRTPSSIQNTPFESANHDLVAEIDQEGNKPLSYNVGVGMSYLNYVEKVNTSTFRLADSAITVKGGVNYRVSPKWDAGASAFFTAVPYKLSSSPNDLSNSRFFGMNARIGYNLLEASRKMRLVLYTGWYFWGMLNQATSPLLTYGASLLSGPQLYLSGKFRMDSGRLYSAYLKAASIQSTPGLSLSSRELAFGGNFQIGPLATDENNRRVWLLGFDLSNTHYAITDQSFELNSISMGITTDF